MTAFYNEIDPYCAQWLRNLINAGEIPPGIVDERSIEDIAPDELAGFTQCHFFAGLGGWPLALRKAGIHADYPLWTGSCPCQPFSAAGKGGGFADERHLWPAFDWLIGQCRPDIVLGEQVEGPAGRKWLDLVATDLEGHGYAFGTAVFPAAGVGAPQIRHRTYWVARTVGERLNGEQICLRPRQPRQAGFEITGGGGVSRLASPNEGQCGRLASSGGRERDGQAGGWQQGDGGASGDCAAGGVGYSECGTTEPWRHDVGSAPRTSKGEAYQREWLRTEPWADGDVSRRSPTNGFWRASDWLYCRDDRWRPTQSEIFPLASGVPARVGKLRAAGNALCVPQAVAFIQAAMSMPPFAEVKGAA
jgi:DNA (cytosine-5)-methyltransferase 1